MLADNMSINIGNEKPAMEDLKELREEAGQILKQLRENREVSSRPIFIEFSGTPKSGKSTCIDIVVHFFRRLEFKVLAPTEGASKRTPYYLKKDWMAFNTWSASYALTHILEGLYGSDEYDLAILDRGLFDALAWFELLCTRNEVSTQERKQIHEFLLIEKWRSKIDAVLLFTADHETSMKRENQDKLIDEPGSAMNPEVLKQINQAYDTVKGEYSVEFPQFETIDTSKDQNTTPRSTAAQATKLILNVFESKLR